MARQDNLKIFTTAILVVLLLSSFIFGFIYRNEIYQKIQLIGKTNSLEKEDRIIEKPWTSPVSSEKETTVANDSLEKEDKSTKTKLPNLPSLEEMDPTWEKPASKSVSVTGSQTEKKQIQKSSEKIAEDKEKKMIGDKFAEEMNLDLPKEVRSQTNSVSKTKKEKQTVVYRSIAKKKQSSPKYTSYTAKKVSDSKSQTKKSWEKQNKPVSSSESKSKQSVSLESRFKDMESKFVLQNQKNEMRFTEIEKRIEKLEKSLGP
ncbi:hypothetical protein [Leptospira sp. 'Mane']|uniref:hypothetical protein n=1 Tax=Leptospira sp. 'Mane' TaxID=3387407 RepID=UPI00398A7D87